MPCKVPTTKDPKKCISKQTCNVFHDKDLHHEWPSKGHLFIEKCEKYCWYCYELWGDTSNWKHAWYLRRHVDSIHAGKTHPELEPGHHNPKHSQNGNAKPWRDAGIPAPMGRKKGTKCPPKTPPPAPTKKTPQRKQPTTPVRQQKRVAQKKKLNASGRATPARKTSASSTASSTPALTIDTSFSTPSSQMQLPDGDGDEDGTMATLGHQSFGENASLPYYHGYGGTMSDLNGVGAGFDSWGNEFKTMNNGLLGHNFNGVVPGYEDIAHGWDGTMSGLDLANNVGFDDNFSNANDFGYDYKLAYTGESSSLDAKATNVLTDPNDAKATAETNAFPQMATAHDVAIINQLCDAYAAPARASAIQESASDNLANTLHETLLMQMAGGNLTEAQALRVLNNVAANFKQS